jgi:uncharacterized protein YjiS (DUF1127 family)
MKHEFLPGEINPIHWPSMFAKARSAGTASDECTKESMMTVTTLAGGFRRLPKAARAAGVIKGAIETLQRWQARARDRRALSLLNDHLLRDIGITRMDVELELYKPLWRA